MKQPDKKPYPNYYYSSVRRKAASDKKKPARPFNRRNLLLSCILIVVAAIVVSFFTAGKSDDAVSSITHSIEKTIKPSSPAVPSDEASVSTMSASINSIISANSSIAISVNLINLENGQSQHYGVNQTFQAASTAKIITAAYFLHQVEAGQESLNETINGNSAQYELQQMIVVSDDNAWAALDNDLGYTNIQNYAATLGITDYQAYNNVLSSGDIALVLQKLWDGSLLNSSDTQLLLSYMQQANYRQYIVPAIPTEDTIYHKIGLYQDNVHDAAIVTHGQQAFVIVIFTNGNGIYNWPSRAIIMQDITKAALEAYFSQP